MATIHLLMLILLHQVVSHSCRGISDTLHSLGPQGSLDDDEQKYGDIRNILHVVPYPELVKWKSNLPRVLPGIKKQNAAPIAIILAPSNIAAKFQHKQIIPGIGGVPQHHVETHTRTIKDSKETELHNKDKEMADVKEVSYSLEKLAFKPSHNSNDEKVKLTDVKSHEYTHFVVDKNTFNNGDDNDESIRYKILADDSPAPFENSVENRKEFDNGDLDESKTDDIITSEERKQIESNRKIDELLSNLNIVKDTVQITKHNFSSEGGDIAHDVDIDIDSTSAEPMKNDHNILVEKRHKLNEKFEKHNFYPNIECIRTDGKYDFQNGTYSIINFLFHFHK